MKQLFDKTGTFINKTLLLAIIMIVPIKCMSCGKPIGHKYDEYKERTEKGEEAGKVMTDLGLSRYCCRGIFLGHVDLLDTVAQFKKA